MTMRLSLGIDTSNYKTSVAVVSQDGDILFNKRSFLDVKKGERGLRQSEAFFQHVNKLPDLLSEIMADKRIREDIRCVAVSNRPRPVEGSYMPVFNAGVSAARILSMALAVPMYEFSHQEGHIEAARYYSEMRDADPFVCFHFSGGTTEAVAVEKSSGRFQIVGGTIDISYGQVLDRLGVAMGFDFPCGGDIDEMAVSQARAGQETSATFAPSFSPIKVKDCFVNLSGAETQGQRLLEELKLGGEIPARSAERFASELMYTVCRSIEDMTAQICEKYGIKDFIFAGGVSSSKYLREYMSGRLEGKVNLAFAEPELSQDNAVGTALLGGSEIWL